jgi:hypothetical protein
VHLDSRRKVGCFALSLLVSESLEEELKPLLDLCLQFKRIERVADLLLLKNGKL